MLVFKYLFFLCTTSIGYRILHSFLFLELSKTIFESWAKELTRCSPARSVNSKITLASPRSINGEPLAIFAPLSPPSACLYCFLGLLGPKYSCRLCNVSIHRHVITEVPWGFFNNWTPQAPWVWYKKAPSTSVAWTFFSHMNFFACQFDIWNSREVFPNDLWGLGSRANTSHFSTSLVRNNKLFLKMFKTMEKVDSLVLEGFWSDKTETFSRVLTSCCTPKKHLGSTHHWVIDLKSFSSFNKA